MNRNYLRWSKLPYAGERKPPTDSITPLAGSWSFIYLNKNENGDYLEPNGRVMNLPIIDPNKVNFEKELKIVQNTLKNITKNEENLAVYYGTGVPAKQWTPVIDRLIDTYDVPPTTSGRILSAVHGAINDAFVMVWDLKYRYDVARPNQYDQTMKTLLCTPRFPTYPSGHATVSGCAATVLSYFFPREARNLQRIADDDALSRLYAGVHFSIDNDEGLNLGRYIGNIIVNQLKTQQNSDLYPIDKPYSQYKNANLFPTNYKQFIPFDFNDSCSSLLLGSDEPSFNKNTPTTKPKLFF